MSEVERLRDRVSQLLQVLGVDEDSTAPLRRAFGGLEPDPARILAMLLKREFVTREGLYTVMYCGRPECDWPDEKVLDVQICRLRARLKQHDVIIQTARGDGWFMSKADKAKVRALVAVAPDTDIEAAARLAEQKARRLAFLEGA